MPNTASSPGLRWATDADVATLARIWYEGWQDAHATLLPDELRALRTEASFAERLRARLADTRVLHTEGKPQGFATLRDNELYQLFLDRSLRGSGAADVLMQDVELQLRERGHRDIYLDCAVGNDRAARFYDKRGWSNVGPRAIEVETTAGPFPLTVLRFEKRLA